VAPQIASKDSVGHYEGDTLVIDTVGVKIGPFAMLDMNGTPHSPTLHVVERYRLLDYSYCVADFRRECFAIGLAQHGHRGKRRTRSAGAAWWRLNSECAAQDARAAPLGR
jgi:hypothetical protein